MQSLHTDTQYELYRLNAEAADHKGQQHNRTADADATTSWGEQKKLQLKVRLTKKKLEDGLV